MYAMMEVVRYRRGHDRGLVISSALNCVGVFFFFQAEDGIRDLTVTGVQTCALPILPPSGLKTIVGMVGVFGILFGSIALGIALSVKRHVTFYRDQSKREKLLDILQDKKFQPITMTYTVRDARGRKLAKLGKNWLFNAVRKRWYVWGPDGRVLFLAKEDSIILSLLRRFLGPLFGVLRTNFIFLPAGTDDVIGEFKRKFTILDRYVLDMTADPQRLMDRRLAIALGVMLDTGERRWHP